MITLKSNRLRVELPEPGEAPNNGYRFDYAGFVSDVILDGAMHFCASEPRNLRHPCSGGRGLCNEYRFDICDNVKIGEYFPKFGIGLFRKEEEGGYVFYNKYRDVKPFAVNVRSDGNSAVFKTEPMPCQGYAMGTVKTVSVEGNSLTMIVEAENTGEKEISAEEYCHNFISIDGMAVGSDYLLELPQCPDLGHNRLTGRDGRPGSLRGNGKGITFCEFSAIDTSFSVNTEELGKTAPFTWRMIHRGAGAAVECEEGFVPSKIAIWAIDHMLCPEIFHGFTLKPGEKHKWTRRWKFDLL